MKQYQITIVINVLADNEEHALEQAEEQLLDGQYTPDIKLMTTKQGVTQ